VNSSSIQITWNTKLDNGREQVPALNADKVSARQAGMAYREEPPRKKPGMRYREEASASASQTVGMAYREQSEVGMRYREEPPRRSGAGMAYREV